MKALSPYDFITKGYYHLPVLLSNLLFLSLFFVLAWNQRLARDDFHFLNLLNEQGIYHGTWVEYKSWSTRYFSVGTNLTVLHFFNKFPRALTAFSLSSLLVFVLAVCWNLKNTLRIIDGKSKNKSILSLLNLSLFIVSILFISTIKIDETWFWLCATCTYIWSVIMVLLGVAWLLNNDNRLPFFAFGLTGFAYLGGASGPLAIIMLLAVAVCLVFARHISNKLKLSARAFRAKSIIGLVVCITTFTVMYLGEGNRVREEFFHDISVLNSLLLNIKMTGIIFIKRLPLTVLLSFCLTFPLIYTGARSKRSHNSNKKKLVFILSLMYVLTVFIYQWSITYKTQDVAAYRALFFVSVLTVVYISCLLYFLGENLKGNKLTNILFYSSFIFGPSLFGYHLMNQRALAFDYSESYDQRMYYLESIKTNEIISLSPLKESGMIYSAEISNDTSFHANKHLEKALDLTAPVTVK